MSRMFLFFPVLIALVLSSCIKDDFIEDFVEPEIRITNSIDTLGVDSIFTYEVSYFNNIGVLETVEVDWSTSDASIVDINDNGEATGVAEGDAVIKASYVNPESGSEVIDTRNVTVGMAILPPDTMNELRSKDGVIVTTSSYALEGDFTFNEEEEGVLIDIANNYVASTALPGLYIYLSNNRNSIANALEVGRVEVFSGAHSYSVPDVGYEDYNFVVYFCKPFNVKVGEAEL